MSAGGYFPLPQYSPAEEGKTMSSVPYSHPVAHQTATWNLTGK